MGTHDLGSQLNWTEDLSVRPLRHDEVDRVAEHLGLARLNQGDGFYLVAWEGDVPAGHLHLALTDPPELQDVEVRAEFRRRGVARALVTAAEDEVARRGVARVRLHVSADDAAAQALYLACGYSDSGEAPVHVRGTIQLRTGPLEVDDHLLTWEKELSSGE